MSATSRLGISRALEARGWEIEFMGPGGDHHVDRSRRLGRGHGSFSTGLEKAIGLMDLSTVDVAIVEWTGVQGVADGLDSAGIPWLIMDRSPPVSTGLVGWVQRRQHAKAWKRASSAVGRIVKSDHMAESIPWKTHTVVVSAGVDTSAYRLAEMNEEPVLVCHGSLNRTRELGRLIHMGFQPYLFGVGDDAARLSTMTRVDGPGDVATRLAACDIGVMHLPDREVWRHASPLKVAEFAAAGLPVVASAVSGLEPHRDADWLTLTPLGDEAAFSEAVRSLLSLDIDERRRLGASARAHAETHLSWDRCTESLHALLLEVRG